MSGTHDRGADAAAYVLGALEPREAEEFGAHLQECAVCREEVEALGGVVRELPLAVPQYAAPRRLRRRVMREMRRDPAAAGTPNWRPGWRIMRARNRMIAGFVGTLAAAAAVVTGIELAVSSGTTVIQAHLAGVSGHAQLRVSNGHAELVVHHLTPPARGHIYEIWLQSGAAAPVPASVLFGVNASGNAEVGIPGSLRGIRLVLVTQEPYGGTAKPTQAPVIVARLT